MGRLSALNLAEVNAAGLRRIRLVKLAYPGQTFYLADQAAPGITYDGQTYTGDGTLIDQGDFTEKMDLSMSPLRLRLSAGNSALKTAFLAGDWHRSLVEIVWGFLNANGTLVDTAESLGTWYMSGGGVVANVIEQYCESLAIDFARTSLITPSDSDQQLVHSGDTFFTNVPALEEMEIAWGGRVMQARSRGGGGNGAGIGSYLTGLPGDAIVNNGIAATTSGRGPTPA